MNRPQESALQRLALGMAIAAVAVGAYPFTVAIACPEGAAGAGTSSLCILGPILVLWPICLAVAGLVTALVVRGLLGAAAILLGVELGSVALASAYPNGFGGLREGDLLDEALGYVVIALTVMLIAYAIGRFLLRISHRHAGAQTMEPAPEGLPEAGRITRNALIAGGLVLVVGLGLILVDPSSRSSDPPGASTPVLETPYWGAGYALSPNDGRVAYRWLEPAGAPCSGSTGRCWHVELVARGCPASLEVEATMLDAAGNKLGTVYGRTGPVVLGRPASISFSVVDERVRSLEMGDVTCE